MEYRHFIKYNKHNKVCKNSFANELEILAQGVGKIFKVTDEIWLVDYKYISSECRKDITYGIIVVHCRQKNEELNHTILTVWGNPIEYPG